jgi:hypothetical protein
MWDPIPGCLDNAMRAIPFWMAYQKRRFPFNGEMLELPLAQEMAALLFGHALNYEVRTEVPYEDLGISLGGRADIVLKPRAAAGIQKPTCVIELKRLEAGGKERFKDAGKIRMLGESEQSLRLFQLFTAQSSDLVQPFVDITTGKAKADIQSDNARIRRVTKALLDVVVGEDADSKLPNGCWAILLEWHN